MALIMCHLFNPAVVRLLVLMVSGPVIASTHLVAPVHLARMLRAAVETPHVDKISGTGHFQAIFLILTNLQCHFQLDNRPNDAHQWTVRFRWSMRFSA